MGSGKNISRALPPTPFLPPRALPPPRVGEITTQPGLRGRGEPGGRVGKQMSPLAAASASGESCAGGPSRGHSPPTSQASRSQLPRLGGGVFSRLSVSRAQLFYLGAVLTRPRLADVKLQPLHDSVIRDRGRGRGAHSTLGCSQRRPGSSAGGSLSSRRPPAWPRTAFVPQKLVVPGPTRKPGFPVFTTRVVEVGKE